MAGQEVPLPALLSDLLDSSGQGGHVPLMRSPSPPCFFADVRKVGLQKLYSLLASYLRKLRAVFFNLIRVGRKQNIWQPQQRFYAPALRTWQHYLLRESASWWSTIRKRFCT